MAVAEKIQPQARHSVVSGYEGDALVEVELGLVLGTESPDQAPWCVDFEGSIRCMSACQVLRRLADGQLSPQTMIWRDGYGTWVPIGDCYELEAAARGELASDIDFEVHEAVEESQVRLRKDVVMRDMAGYRRKRALRSLQRLPWSFFALTFAASLVIFCVFYFAVPQAASVSSGDEVTMHREGARRLQPMLPSLLSELRTRRARVLQAEWQKERSWWLARWPKNGR